MKPSNCVGTDSISDVSTDAAKRAIFAATALHWIAAAACEPGWSLPSAPSRPR